MVPTGSESCVHQEQRSVRHAQGPLHLTAKVGVARRIDEIDLLVFPSNRRVLRQNRDAALLLEVDVGDNRHISNHILHA